MATHAILKYPTLKLRRLKYPLRQLHLHVIGHRHEFVCETMTFGVPGAEWVFCPTTLNNDSVIYGFGVGNNISFDLGVIKNIGATVHAFDPTPRSAEWVRSQSLPPDFVFHELGVANYDGTLSFYQPKSKTSYHFTPVQRYRSDDKDRIDAPVRKLSTIMDQIGHDHIDLLKLDIEGGEYDVIDDMLKANILPTQLLVEFHHMFSTIPMKRTLDTVAQLREAGYGIMHISPRTYEYTLLHKSSGIKLKHAAPVPR